MLVSFNNGASDDSAATFSLPVLWTLRDLDAATSAPLQVRPEGSFTLEDLAPGTHRFAIRVTYFNTDTQLEASGQNSFTVTVLLLPPPAAEADASTGKQGRPQSVDPLMNDRAAGPSVSLDPASLTLISADGTATHSIEVPGEGACTVVDGKIVFTPEPTFTGVASSVAYRVSDEFGTPAQSTYTPTVTPPTAPIAQPDESAGSPGASQSVDPLGNDTPGEDGAALDPASLSLLDADGRPVQQVTVPGEGVYTIENGRIVFAPEPGFTGTGSGVAYRVADADGLTAESTYTPTVEPAEESPVGPSDPTQRGEAGTPAESQDASPAGQGAGQNPDAPKGGAEPLAHGAALTATGADPAQVWISALMGLLMVGGGLLMQRRTRVERPER